MQSVPSPHILNAFALGFVWRAYVTQIVVGIAALLLALLPFIFIGFSPKNFDSLIVTVLVVDVLFVLIAIFYIAPSYAFYWTRKSVTEYGALLIIRMDGDSFAQTLPLSHILYISWPFIWRYSLLVIALQFLFSLLLGALNFLVDTSYVISAISGVGTFAGTLLVSYIAARLVFKRLLRRPVGNLIFSIAPSPTPKYL